ncbi:MAG: TetR/AcrR family transcriptional regulator [Spirochaetaceae bacterium]|nr:TetR/AcrR family transcriptional regulator [Spirochaetaceae bacterium]
MEQADGKNINEIRNSKSRLISTATQLFAEKWYGAVSVAEICRHAGLSNGCFYRYYKTKEELFRSILEDITLKIDLALVDVKGDCAEARLRSFAEIVFNFSRDNVALIRVFREGQYRFFEYEERLKDIYITSLGEALGSPTSQAEYEFALGGLRFAAIRAAFYGIPARLDAIQEILANGLFGDMEVDDEKVFSGTPRPLSTIRASGARERLLQEGRKLLGRQGYFETNIHQITDAAGLSVGAFYTHFESKEVFYGELIGRVGSDLRHFISLNMGQGLNRCEREMRGLWLFVIYLSHDPNCYNIVREAEFVLPDAVRSYYDAFVKGYRKHPEGSGGLDETTSIEFLLGVAHYFGLEVVFNESPGNVKSRVKEIGRLLRSGLRARL